MKSKQISIEAHDPDDIPRELLASERHFADIVDARFSRRSVLKGGVGAAVTSLFAGGALVACSSDNDGSPVTPAPQPRLGFEPIPVSDADTVVVPPGYSVQVLAPWGDPIFSGVPDFSLSNTGEHAGGQVGSHHDGMHYFPINDVSANEDGLLVLNHEYVEPRFMHASFVGKEAGSGTVFVDAETNTRPADEVLKEMNAHGVTVVRIQKGSNGQWATVVGDPLNRRITALTEMEFSGPVRGTDFVKTPFSPEGTRTRGTLNNCAHGVTPWNTYMISEENWAGYFTNAAGAGGRYSWHLADGGDINARFSRFNVQPTGETFLDDYRNEANGQGYMVEFDPFDPSAAPIKRTALGRFAHEGVIFHQGVAGEPVVCYSGHDSTNQFIYKFVSAGTFGPNANGSLLDTGVLYAAKFNDDGTGQWLPLVFGQGVLTVANGWSSQADVIIRTVQAARDTGATPMDRPEWGAIDPVTQEVYFALTNNTGRTETDAANPRPSNNFGHIIRWTETDGLGGDSFAWDLFVLGGGPDDDSQNFVTGERLDASNAFGSPDGLWIDPDRRVWIQTDIGESQQNTGVNAQFGNNQMLAADPETGDIRRFLTGPAGQETTGVITTPDGKTMFVNFQHPGAQTTPAAFAAGNITSSFAAKDGVPRSATIVITRDDGGVIGT